MSYGETGVKSRYIDTFYDTFHYVMYGPQGQIVTQQSYKYLTSGKQTTISRGTFWPLIRATQRRTHSRYGAGIDWGSNFYTSSGFSTPGIPVKASYQVAPGYIYYASGDAQAHNVTGTSGPLPYPAIGEISNLYAKGATAIARCSPVNPVAGLANFLGELKRDGLPNLPGESMRKEVDLARGSASEYLNYQFAISPTMNDLKSFVTAVRTRDKVLKQYIRDSGKGIRRRYSFPVERSIVTTSETGVYPAGLDTQFVASPGTKTKIVETTRRTWFSGQFCYYLDKGNTAFSKSAYYAQLANRLFGTTLTPEVVWNLAPWSWAADWFFNMGDVLHNVSQFQSDGLVLQYGYVMEHLTITTTYRLEGYVLKGAAGNSVGPPLTQTYTQQRKVRLKATPFGFGLNFSGLSPRQLAIMTALGISRSPSSAK